MACQKIKGQKYSKNAAHHRAPVDPIFSSSEIDIDKDQNQNTRRSLVTSALLFKQDDVYCPSRSQPKLAGGAFGLGNWMEQAKTMFSSDKTKEQQARPSPANWYDSIFSEVVHEASATSDGVKCQKQGDEGLFAGKRFFCVAAPPIVEKISTRLSIEEAAPMFYMPRCA